jgi:excisionase family DNA binding protein
MTIVQGGDVATAAGPLGDPDDWPNITAADLSRRWNYDVETIRRFVRSGDLPAMKLGRVLRFTRRDVLAFEERARLAAVLDPSEGGGE